MGVLFVLIFWVGIAVAGAAVASGKGRSGAGWFFLCLLFPIAIIVIAALPRAGAPAIAADAPSLPAEATKICPQCAETVKAAAHVCRFCRHEFAT